MYYQQSIICRKSIGKKDDKKTGDEDRICRKINVPKKYASVVVLLKHL
jgi:hypothetical protein